MEDALYAQLLSMGFDISLIERYRLVMASSDTPRDLTAATEWLLEHAARQPGQATPTSAHVEDVQQPMSSTKDFSSSSAEGSGPLHSRYAMSERQARDKQRYQSKEREEVVRKARETKAAEQKAKQLIKQQIADDRKARSLRGEHGPVEVAVVKEGAGAIAAPVGSTSDTCRVQVRLPDGKSLRYTLQSSTTLREVSKAVMADAPNLPAVLQFVQPFPPHEYTPDECQRTLKALGLCPSASLVVHLPKHSAPEHDQPMDTSHSQDTSHSPSSVDPTGERTGEVGHSIEEAESAEQPHPPEDEAENMDVEGLDVRQPPPPPLADVRQPPPPPLADVRQPPPPPLADVRQPPPPPLADVRQPPPPPLADVRQPPPPPLADVRQPPPPPLADVRQPPPPPLADVRQPPPPPLADVRQPPPPPLADVRQPPPPPLADVRQPPPPPLADVRQPPPPPLADVRQPPPPPLADVRQPPPPPLADVRQPPPPPLADVRQPPPPPLADVRQPPPPPLADVRQPPPPPLADVRQPPPPPLADVRQPPPPPLADVRQPPPPPLADVRQPPPPPLADVRQPPPPPLADVRQPPPPPLADVRQPPPPPLADVRQPPPPPLADVRQPPPPPLADVRQPPPPPLADVARRHVRFDMPVRNPLLVAQGGGHRLGGTLQPTHRSGEGSHDAALEATLRRIQVAPPPSGVQVHKVWPSVQTLENLCVKYLLGMSGAGGLPTSCGSLPPRLVQLIITRLAEAKQLNGKTLLALHKCPLESITLDNYVYATNDLLATLKYFPTLTSLSLAFCSLITDKAVMALLPYLPSLTHINLNGCRQLNEVICRSIKGCKSLKVLKLGHVKVGDEGMRYLLPLEQLEELDLSHTLITSTSLHLLPEGTPNLQILSIEATKADNFVFLCQLRHLHTLSVSQCPASSVVGSLAGCRVLHSLNLTDVPVEHWALQQLSCLHLTSLKLPSRNTFMDDDMVIVSGFSLTSLDLSDYCFITDAGIANIATMHGLTDLSLCRTKLTDDGMVALEGLLSLRQLRLDNTMVTDAGMKHVAGLVFLDQLSISDTRVTSRFILDGCLDRLTSLTKLNLSRTAVCDKGAARLRLPSLSMLNFDWTCVSEATSLDQLKASGCPFLDTLRVSNIRQPKPSWVQQEGEEPQT